MVFKVVDNMPVTLFHKDKIQFYFLINFNNLSLHISNSVTIHNHEAFTLYAAYGIYRTSTLTSC
jgi:hypothetical protein